MYIAKKWADMSDNEKRLSNQDRGAVWQIAKDDRTDSDWAEWSGSYQGANENGAILANVNDDGQLQVALYDEDENLIGTGVSTSYNGAGQVDSVLRIHLTSEFDGKSKSLPLYVWENATKETGEVFYSFRLIERAGRMSSQGASPFMK